MSESTKNNERELADAAWTKLQSKLAQEPVQPQWSRWSEQMTTGAAAPLTAAITGESAAAPSLSPEPNIGPRASRPGSDSAGKKTSGSFAVWMQRNKKWVASAAAVGVIAVTIATPSGNQALAAILNKFRMQQLTVVQEEDLQAILSGAFGDGKERESINKFGTFSQTSGKSVGEVDASEAAKLLGHKLVIPSDYSTKNNNFYVSPTNSITFNMNVDEVNKAMKRLGATKLLPDSVDGKPITLEMGAAVHLYVPVDPEEKIDSKGYSFTQMTLPTITVDPSIPVAEALDAVLQFPLLPSNLKESLQTAGILQGGSVPLPIIENGQVEKIKVEGMDVIVSTNLYNQGKKAYYSATWVKQGQLFRLDGSNALTSREALIAKATELIKS